MRLAASIISSTLNAGTPLLIAAVGILIHEKSGVLNLGIEGIMLMGAVAGFGTTMATGSFALGFLAGMGTGILLGLLFAFFTNKKWVFTTADQSVSTGKQLVTFAGSRLVTFGLDYVITFAGTFALAKLFPSLVAVFLLGKERNLAEILSKVVAAVVVIICNYIISKLLVFKKRKSEEKPLE